MLERSKATNRRQNEHSSSPVLLLQHYSILSIMKLFILAAVCLGFAIADGEGPATMDQIYAMTTSDGSNRYYPFIDSMKIFD